MKSSSSNYPTAVSRRQLLQLGLGGLSAVSTISSLAQSATSPEQQPVVASEPWSTVRDQVVLDPQLAYFDTASAGPVIRAVLAAEYRSLEAINTDPQEFFASRFNTQAVRHLCERIATWLNCSREELTLTSGAQSGMELFANSFNFQMPLQAGDELVLGNQLSAAATAFWTRWGQQRGMAIKTLVLPSPLTSDEQVIDAFTAGLNDRSRVVIISHVQHGDGARLPVHEICNLARDRKVLSIVDGTLSLGAMAVSVADMNCDVFTGSFCHWLNGPRHTGVLYVRQQLHSQLPYFSDSLDDMLDLNSAAWPTLLARMPQQFLRHAPQFQALPLALSLQENLGMSVVAARIRELSSYARLQMQSAGMQLLTPVPGQMWSNILAIRTTHDVAEIISYLRHTDRVEIGGFKMTSGNVLRISFHIYNSLDDVDRLIRGLKRTLRNQTG